MRWILLLLLFPSVLASEMMVDITLTKDGLAVEEISIYSDEVYDTISYDAGAKPITVVYDGEYVVNDNVITFPYVEVLEFGLIFDDRVEHLGSKRVFRSVFVPGVDEYTLTITLPEKYVLYGDPAVIPRPDNIETDGKEITMSWQFSESTEVSVFYEGSSSNLYLWIALIALVFIIVLVFILKKPKVEQYLSDDENAVLKLVKKVKRQDHIAKELEFSKSKMSKVVRKLEEKGLIKKKPYFKTNILEKA